jgi:hypothetical protein
MDRVTQNYECAHSFDLPSTPHKPWTNRGEDKKDEIRETFEIGNTTAHLHLEENSEQVKIKLNKLNKYNKGLNDRKRAIS